MIARDSRPRLAPKVRLRFDRQTDGWLLLYPEKGLALAPSSADILLLCTGEHSVAAIVDRLAAQYEAQPGEIQDDVLAFLSEMLERALIQL